MLSRGGGKTHGGGVRRHPRFQEVVNTVADLPSTIDAEPGTRIIVRETEEVYGLDKVTRMWSVIGTLKKVGGKLPEELAAHVDSGGNPHKTSFQDILDTGQSVKVTEEIVISGKGPLDQLRLLSVGAAIRIGPTTGNKEGILWVNAGNGTKTVMRAVSNDGHDLFVVAGDGSLVSSGSASFAAGFKGPAHFDSEVTASEGLYGAKGFDLVLGTDKSVVFQVEGRARAQLSASGLKLAGSLDVKSGFSVAGTVRSNLNPSPTRSLTLGVSTARWKSAALVDLDLSGATVIQVPPNSKQAPLQILGAAPGNALVISPAGRLGLGTSAPDERLDVRGNIVVSNHESRLKLDGRGISCGSWDVSFGSEFILKDAAGARLAINKDGTTISGTTRAQGDLIVRGQLSIGGVTGLRDESIIFSSGSTLYKAKSHSFTGPMRVSSSSGQPFEVAGTFACKDGDLVGAGGSLRGWTSLSVGKSVAVADTSYDSGRISHPGEFSLDVPVLVTNNLRLLKSPKIEVMNTLRLEGAGGFAEFSLGGSTCGLSFQGKRWELDGVTSLTADEIKAGKIKAKGGAEFCNGEASLENGNMRLSGNLSIAGLTLRHHCEELDLSVSNRTKFEIPVGVRVEAVLVRLNGDVGGVRFLMVGDSTDPNRFAGPSTDLKAGALIRGMDHWAQSRMVQKIKAPIVVSGDGPATGDVSVTIHYVDPAAL